MKVSDLVKELELTVFCGEENLDAVVKGGYTSDLLSDVMGHMDHHANPSEHRCRFNLERCGGCFDRERCFTG